MSYDLTSTGSPSNDRSLWTSRPASKVELEQHALARRRSSRTRSAAAPAHQDAVRAIVKIHRVDLIAALIAGVSLEISFFPSGDKMLRRSCRQGELPERLEMLFTGTGLELDDFWPRRTGIRPASKIKQARAIKLRIERISRRSFWIAEISTQPQRCCKAVSSTNRNTCAPVVQITIKRLTA